jgi:hypothetical protein
MPQGDCWVLSMSPGQRPKADPQRRPDPIRRHVVWLIVAEKAAT